MANTISIRGNLGQDPELKTAPGRGDSEEARSVCALRIYVDRPVPVQGEFEDRGGFWLDVDVWNQRGIDAARVLRKGMRVHVVGSLRQDEWKDRETGDPRHRLVMTADYVSLDLGRVESVTLRQKNAEAA